MKTEKQFKAASIVVMSLGIIHICATPFVLPMFRILGTTGLLTFAYMFVFTGLAIFSLGWLQNFIISKLAAHEGFKTILKVTVIVVSLSGIGAVATMFSNPFAYIILLVALYECFLLPKILKS